MCVGSSQDYINRIPFRFGFPVGKSHAKSISSAMFASIILCQDKLMRSLYMACRLFAGHDRLRQPVKNAAVGSIPRLTAALA